MRSRWVLFGTVSLSVSIVLTAASVSKGVSLDIFVDDAPNATANGAGFQDWFDNAQSAIRSGSTAAGPNGPRGYKELAGTGETSSRRPFHEIVASTFNSWNGMAPNSTHPNQFGHRMHFVYSIERDDSNETLELSKIDRWEVFQTLKGSTDETPLFENFFGDPQPDSNLRPLEFDPKRRVGFTPNGTKITSGNNNKDTTIEQIIGTVGMAFESDNPSGSGLTDQEALDQTISAVGPVDEWRGEITYDGQTASTTVQTVPLPASAWAGLSLLGLLAGGAALRRGRFTKAAA